MNSVKVSLGNRSYNILIGQGLTSSLGSILKDLKIGRNAFIVTNSKIARLYCSKIGHSLAASGITSKIALVPDSEKAKSHKTLIDLLNKIGAYDKNKSLFIVALGGGVVGDVAGFAASIYKRGIPYIQIPTTLLAQVDSAIGGKTAIDLPMAKNLIGSFYQPKAVISDISLLRSLSKRQIKNGLAECIKYGIIKDRGLFEYLEDNYKKIISLDKTALQFVVLASSKIKARVVEADEFDKKAKRAVLNYGHTIGHAIEAASSYSKKYNHGEAIAIGMAVAGSISLKIGLMKTDDRLRIESLIKKSGLPVKIEGLKISGIYNAYLHDKKFIHGKNRLVLPIGIGSVRIVDGVPDPIVIKSIKEYME